MAMTNYEDGQLGEPNSQTFENTQLVIGGVALDPTTVSITVGPTMLETDPIRHQEAMHALAALANYGTDVIINIQPKKHEVPFSERPYLDVIEEDDGDILAITEASLLNHVGTIGRYENTLGTIKGVTTALWRRMEEAVKSGGKVYNPNTDQHEQMDIRHLVVLDSDDKLAYIPAVSFLGLYNVLGHAFGRNEARILDRLQERIQEDVSPTSHML
jgi:hypothetical protein